MIVSTGDELKNVTEKTFFEIRFHGRGGQGAVSAAALLAMAAFDAGFQAQAFPKFGSERRGAPVEAYVRVSSTAIRAHNQVYTPDIVIVQDSTLMHSSAVLEGLKHNGLILLNSEHQVQQQIQIKKPFRLVSIGANRISEKYLGRPLPNTVLLGALAASIDWASLATLERAITRYLARKGQNIIAANIDALREGFRVASLQHEETL